MYIITHTSTTPRYDFILDLVENPSIDPGNSRLFCHIWWRTQASIAVPFVLFITSGGEPKHRSRSLSFFCLIWWRTQASMPVTLVFFYHIWWITQASIAVPLVFSPHLVENPRIDPGTSRLFWNIWWRSQVSIPAPLVFFVTSGGGPKHRSRCLSTFLPHLLENPSIDLGTSWFFLSYLVESLASMSVPVDFFFLSGGEFSTSRLSCHKYVVIPMNIQTTEAIIIICNIFLQ
jgi:hypothetical protein